MHGKESFWSQYPNQMAWYGPVSLTSCFQIMERIILNKLIYILEDKFSCNLCGFLKGKSTAEGVVKCYSYDADKYRVFVELKGAFDKANGEVILYELEALVIPGKKLKWMRDYKRSAYVWYQGSRYNESKFELSTPQGRVLSLILFTVYWTK